MNPPKVGELYEVEIGELAFRGPGVGRLRQINGFVVFVPFAAPGDLLKVQITETKKNYATAKIIEILRSSGSRRPAPCPYYLRCGGCNWQHITYQEQLLQKNKIIQKFFSEHKSRVLNIIPSPNEFEYRSHVHLHSAQGKIGYFEKGTHSIVDIEKCLISSPSINELLAKVRTEPLSSEKVLKFFTKSDGTAGIANPEANLEEHYFSQVNQGQIDNIKSRVTQKLKELSFSSFLDLYAGSGNFSLSLLEHFPSASFVAAELNARSVELAKETSQKRKLRPGRFEIYLSAVDHFLRRYPIKKGSVVMLNPPRVGANTQIMRELAQTPIQYLFYLSCNPSTLQRDLGVFMANAGGEARVDFIQPYDMFPQTDHIEVLAGIQLLRPS